MLDVASLVKDLNNVAAETWNRVVYSFEEGFAFGEGAITEANLYQLSRLHPRLLTRRFNSKEEPLNGADWEWWIGSRSSGWIGVRLQAKKIDADGNYSKLSYRTGSESRLQYDLLIETSAEDSRRIGTPILPFFCFYNGWQDQKWPDDVPSVACPRGAVPPKCTHTALLDYGCAIAPAPAVARVHAGPRGTKTALNGHLAQSRPWSQLFYGGERKRLSGKNPDAAVLADGVPGSLPERLGRTMQAWHEGLADVDGPNGDLYGAFYLDRLWTPGREVPAYVYALLDGRPVGRDVYPQATYVVVLNTDT